MVQNGCAPKCSKCLATQLELECMMFTDGRLQGGCGSLTVERHTDVKYSKESLAEKNLFFFSFFFFNTTSLPSMLSCNPSVFCVAPADYSAY